MTDMIHIVAKAHPLSSRTMALDLPAGLTLAEIVAETGVPERLVGMTAALVEDVPVPAELWQRVRPKPGRQVTLVVVPRGGGDKGILRAVLQIAVAAAAAAAGIVPVVGIPLSVGIALAGDLAVDLELPEPSP